MKRKVTLYQNQTKLTKIVQYPDDWSELKLVRKIDNDYEVLTRIVVGKETDKPADVIYD